MSARKDKKKFGAGFSWLSLAVISALLVAWVLLTPRVIPELVFPSPQSVWDALVTLNGRLASDALITLARVLAGWTLGCAFGIAVGFLMTRSRTVLSITDPIIEMVRPIPTVALIPFFIIWFGLGYAGQIGLVALGCFMVLVVNTFVAVQNVSPIYVRAAASLGASSGQIYRTILFPAIMPTLISGFRIAAALAFGTAVAAEFMGAQSGIGFLIMVARRTLNTNTILLGTLVIGLESFLFDWAIRHFGGYLVRWSETPIEALERIG